MEIKHHQSEKEQSTPWCPLEGPKQTLLFSALAPPSVYVRYIEIQNLLCHLG